MKKCLAAMAAAFAVAMVMAAPAAATNPPEHKVTICHHPPGNPDNPQTIEVGVSALLPHLLLHGDTIGEVHHPARDPRWSRGRGGAARPKL